MRICSNTDSQIADTVGSHYYVTASMWMHRLTYCHQLHARVWDSRPCAVAE